MLTLDAASSKLKIKNKTSTTNIDNLHDNHNTTEKAKCKMLTTNFHTDLKMTTLYLPIYSSKHYYTP